MTPKTILRLALIGALAAAVIGPAVAAPVPPRPAAADWRTPDPENTLVIDTNKGRIIVELAPGIAPNHVERIKTLTRQGFYDGRTFFRVIEGFMDQTGDPLETGEGQSSLPNLEPEFSFRRGADQAMTVADRPGGKEAGLMGTMPVISEPIIGAMMTLDGRVTAYSPFCSGVLGMARASEPNSGNSQFFLMRADYRNLDNKYTAFGRVISGLDVVRAVKVGEPVAEPRDRMERVRLLADIPETERPRVRVIDTRGAWFKAYAAAKAASTPSFNICDLEVPAEVTAAR